MSEGTFKRLKNNLKARSILKYTTRASGMVRGGCKIFDGQHSFLITILIGYSLNAGLNGAFSCKIDIAHKI